MLQRSELHNDQQIGLAIGAGREQLASIVAAKARGLRVVAIDGNPHAPGLQIADLGEVIDLRDANAVVRFALAHRVTFTLAAPIGRLLTTQAVVHEALGLHGVRPECAAVCTDKQQFHKRMCQAGVDVPWQLALTTEQKLLELKPQGLPFPLVLKPICGSGSRGVRIIAALQDWADAVLDALAKAPSEGWVLESLIDGAVLGVDGAVIDSRSQIVLVREKSMSPWPNRVELAYRAPALLPDGALEQLQTMLNRAWGALETDVCLFHADVILNAEGLPVLIEMSARPSGLGIAAELVPACTDVDFLSQGISLHIAGDGDFKPRRARPTLLHQWHHPGGFVQRVPRVDELLGLPHVLSAEVGWSVGQHVQWPENVGELLPAGHLLVSAPSWVAVESTMNQALSLFEVTPFEIT